MYNFCVCVCVFIHTNINIVARLRNVYTSSNLTTRYYFTQRMRFYYDFMLPETIKRTKSSCKLPNNSVRF